MICIFELVLPFITIKKWFDMFDLHFSCTIRLICTCSAWSVLVPLDLHLFRLICFICLICTAWTAFTIGTHSNTYPIRFCCFRIVWFFVLFFGWYVYGLKKSTPKSRNVSTIFFFGDGYLLGFFISWIRTNYNGGSGISVSISLPVVASSIHLPICFVIKCSIAIKSLLNSLDPRKP